MMLFGCSATPERVVVKTEYIRQFVPIVLAADCAVPPLPSENVTNETLVPYMIGMELAIEDCNADKRAIRQWQSMESVTQ
jgi:hypothetical protein